MDPSTKATYIALQFSCSVYATRNHTSTKRYNLYKEINDDDVNEIWVESIDVKSFKLNDHILNEYYDIDKSINGKISGVERMDTDRHITDVIIHTLHPMYCNESTHVKFAYIDIETDSCWVRECK